ncbi:MAG: DUF3137 domain-containing protein [Cytophagales bacterium]|nr:DUF3137 domain-containing protein [Cytophagales bacterium]
MLDAKELLTELRSELEEAEQKRQHHYKRVRPFRIIFNLTGIALLGAIAYAIYDSENGGEILGIGWAPFMIMLVVYGIKYDFEKGKFKYHFQQRVVSKIIPKLGPSFSYQSRGGFGGNRLIESRFFDTFKTYLSEDFVHGKVNNRTISFAETKLEYRGSGSDDKTRTIFNGIYAEIKLSSRFASSCWLMPKKKKLSKNKGVTRVTFGEKEARLLNKYRLYAEEETFAKQLFTADVLGKLMTINQDLRSKKVTSADMRFAFMGDTIRLAFNLRHKFMEPDLLKPVNTEAYLQKELALLKELARLAELV